MTKICINRYSTGLPLWITKIPRLAFTLNFQDVVIDTFPDIYPTNDSIDSANTKKFNLYEIKTVLNT